MSKTVNPVKLVKDNQQYGKLPPKFVITTQWEALCVDLIGPHTPHGKDGAEIDFLCLTIIAQ